MTPARALAALALVGVVLAGGLLVVKVDVEPMGDMTGFRCSPLSEHDISPQVCEERVRPRRLTGAWLAVGSSALALVAVARRGRRYRTATGSLRLIGDLYLALAVLLTAVAGVLLASDRLVASAASGVVAGLFGLLTFAVGGFPSPGGGNPPISSGARGRTDA